jgi:hypothetical protein
MRKATLLLFATGALLFLFGQSVLASIDTRLVFVSNTYNSPSTGQGTLVLQVQARSNVGSSSVAISAFQDAFQLDAALRAQYVSSGFSSQRFSSSNYTTTEDYNASSGKIEYIYTYNSGTRSTIGTNSSYQYSSNHVVTVSIIYNMAPTTTTISWYDGIPNYYVTNSSDVEVTGSEVAIPGTLMDIPLTDGPLPIQLASFTASVVRGNDVEVAWKTVSETNNYGFEIYRKRGDAGEWEKISFVQGHGTTLAPQSYTYVDAGLSFGKYCYQIKQIDLDGKSETLPAMEVTVGTGPGTFVLAQNYPNPFNPSTLIEFVVPMSGHATMKVYNVLGQEVATLFDGNAQAGTINTARFNASNMPSGTYFYTLRSAGQTETKRMLLTK